MVEACMWDVFRGSSVKCLCPVISRNGAVKFMLWNMRSESDGAIGIFVDVAEDLFEAIKMPNARGNAEAPHSGNMYDYVKPSKGD